MGRQTARIYLNGKDHKEIYVNKNYHNSASKNSNVLWEKLDEEFPEGVFVFTARDTMVSYFDDDWSPEPGTIYLTVAGSEELIIDWGDGTETRTKGTTNTYSQALVHKYPTSNNTLYTVKIYGEMVYFYPTLRAQSAYNSCIEEIKTPFPLSFCENVEYKFPSLFNYCKSIKKIPSKLLSAMIGYEGTIKASSMFGHSGLKEIPGNLFSGLNMVSNSLFFGCADLEYISPNAFNGFQGDTLAGAFGKCTSLQYIPNGLFDGYKGTSLEKVFYECTSLMSIPENIFDFCTNLTNVSKAFYGCYSIKGRLPELWLEERFTVYESCFYRCLQADNYNDVPYYWSIY